MADGMKIIGHTEEAFVVFSLATSPASTKQTEALRSVAINSAPYSLLLP